MRAMATRRHRVSAATAQMRAAADAVADASVWSMDAEETAATLVELTRAINQATELRARVAAHADDLHVGQDKGASSAAAWLAHETNTTRAAAHAAVRLGRDLDAHTAVRDALAAGDLHVEQARVIVHWIDDLPDTVPAEKVTEAEAHLLE